MSIEIYHKSLVLGARIDITDGAHISGTNHDTIVMSKHKDIPIECLLSIGGIDGTNFSLIGLWKVSCKMFKDV